MSLFHTELLADYGATARLTLSLRLPYDVKDQKVRYETLDGQPYVPPYGDIHHRTETLRGFSDAEATALFPLGPLLVGAGLSLPIGQTVENPIVLGREGRIHEHIQFGTGTFDPLVSVLWTTSLPWLGSSITAAADGQFPLYQNSKGYRAPFTVHYSAGPSLPVGPVGVSLMFAGQYQSIGRWEGEQDEGSGFHNGGVSLRAAFFPGQGFRVSAGVYREVYSHSLSTETFSQGTTWSLTLSRFF